MPGPKPKPLDQKYRKRTITLPPDLEAYLVTVGGISAHLATLVRESPGYLQWAAPAR